jgi:hypothetical protein
LIWRYVPKHLGHDARADDESSWRADEYEAGPSRGFVLGPGDDPGLEDPSARPAAQRVRVHLLPLPDLGRRANLYRTAGLTRPQMVAFDLVVRGFHVGPISRGPIAEGLGRTPRAIRGRLQLARRNLAGYSTQYEIRPMAYLEDRTDILIITRHVLGKTKNLPRFPISREIAITEQAAINGVHENADHTSEEAQAQ